jgi:hypothetical protein
MGILAVWEIHPVSAITADRSVFPHEVLGNHRQQSQQSRLELGLRLTIWIADAHRGDGSVSLCTRLHLLTAFLELESAIHSRGELS